ncbi:MAG TPA: hypothetical protein VMW95_07405, partial [Desulfobacterales bacterium]|nr:hypothetical protein [Desulfobacterales bacterium]
SDSIEDYSSEVGFSVGFPPGSYPDSSIITLHKLLKRLNGIDVPGKDQLDGYLRHVTRRNRRPKTLYSLFTSTCCNRPYLFSPMNRLHQSPLLINYVDSPKVWGSAPTSHP